jgi:hypothetical protein
VVAGSLLVFTVCGSLAAETSTNSNAPTGLYVSEIGPSWFIVRLNTNQEYQVYSTPFTNIQEGRWKWDAKRQEFLLTPVTNTNSFGLEFRRLRVAPHESDTLQWIPLGGGAAPGAIDYIRFKRQRE